jgi:hypothetical protein
MQQNSFQTLLKTKAAHKNVGQSAPDIQNIIMNL